MNAHPNLVKLIKYSGGVKDQYVTTNFFWKAIQRTNCCIRTEMSNFFQSPQRRLRRCMYELFRSNHKITRYMLVYFVHYTTRAAQCFVQSKMIPPDTRTYGISVNKETTEIWGEWRLLRVTYQWCFISHRRGQGQCGLDITQTPTYKGQNGS